MKRLYLILTVIGLIAPYYFGFQLVQEQGGFDIILFLQDATSTTAASFLAADLTVAGLAAMLFIIHEGLTRKIKYWWVSIVGIFAVGVSFGLPLFLYLREREKDRISS